MMQHESALKPEFGVARLLAVLVFLLAHCFEGQSVMIGSSKPIVALVGDDIILPCQLESTTNVVSLTLEWARPDLTPRFILLRRDGVELLLDQNPSYIGRTSVSVNKLKWGDISLKLSKVRLSDAGTYRCLIPSLEGEALVELVVGSVPSPVTVTIDRSRDGMRLECESAGWYPEPKVHWLDAEGKIFSAGRTEMLKGPDGLYTVSSSVTVDIKHGKTFTCKLQHKYNNHTRETVIHIPDDMFVTSPSAAARIAISLSACFMCVLTAFILVWKWSPNKTKMEIKDERGERDDHHGREHQSLVRDCEQSATGNKRLKPDHEEGEEELERTKEELTYVDEVIKTLRELKEDLIKQRNTIASLLQNLNTEMEEIKKKLEKFAGPDKKKKRQDTKTNLEKRRKGQEELSALTEKLLEKTEAMINKMNVKKGQLANQKQHLETREKKTGGHRVERKPEQVTPVPTTEKHRTQASASTINIDSPIPPAVATNCDSC
ncbi:butyrophilin subfamily 3 member A2-like [Genypterus blacodes]|uniref:butyrophilin subfamily 3 member A2-like n=1 Tax=Genypterus blacodes TaxID=154954 RepID=UPI003F760B03